MIAFYVCLWQGIESNYISFHTRTYLQLSGEALFMIFCFFSQYGVLFGFIICKASRLIRYCKFMRLELEMWFVSPAMLGINCPAWFNPVLIEAKTLHLQASFWHQIFWFHRLLMTCFAFLLQNVVSYSFMWKQLATEGFWFSILVKSVLLHFIAVPCLLDFPHFWRKEF